MNKNSDNPKVGKAFQELVLKNMQKFFEKPFEMEKAIPIGTPSKNHKFDCVSDDGEIVVECKCYTWTNTGNVPSAKLMGLNEALFYMSYLADNITKIVCIKKATYPGKKETLGEYYCRINGHLFRDVKIFEVDEQGNFTILRE